MKRKIYEPVRKFERQTSYCPLYLAWRIVDEARDYFRTPIPEAFADKLAHRAEAIFAHQPFWARKASPRAGSRKAAAHAGSQQEFECRRQREFILMSMRHWLAGVLARERPALFRALPESFKIGLELPIEHAVPVGRGYRRTGLGASKRSDDGSRGRSAHRPANHFVHGCELIPV
jgi:hypothetical protein